MNKVNWVANLALYLCMLSPMSANAEGLDSCEQSSRVAYNQCLDELLASTQQQADGAYQARKRQAMELQQISSGAQGLVMALEQARLSFEAYRYAHCNWRRLEVASGSGSGTEWRICHYEMTAQWLQQLAIEQVAEQDKEEPAG